MLADNENRCHRAHRRGQVRNRAAVTFGNFYGISAAEAAHQPDPATKGGVENAVKRAKTSCPETSACCPGMSSFAEVEAACAVLTAEINARVHRGAGRRPR